ncbi:hypothetical protein RFI_29443, partial [Reticulomyxa filosa]
KNKVKSHQIKKKIENYNFIKKKDFEYLFCFLSLRMRYEEMIEKNKNEFQQVQKQQRNKLYNVNYTILYFLNEKLNKLLEAAFLCTIIIFSKFTKCIINSLESDKQESLVFCHLHEEIIVNSNQKIIYFCIKNDHKNKWTQSFFNAILNAIRNKVQHYFHFIKANKLQQYPKNEANDK